MTSGGLDREPLDAIVRSYAAERRCPRLAWGVTVDGRLTTGAVGEATEHTVFRIASMTKSFSAAATLLLRDEGVLGLDEPVRTYVPELRSHGSADAAPITVRDLLSMTSGLPTDDPWADRHLDLTDDELDRILDEGPLFAAPTGTTYEYSNLGFAILGRVVHRATGEPIQTIVSKRLLAPLGMTSTTWVQPSHDDWARPTRWLDDEHVAERPPLGDGTMAPMGGLWSSVTDLERWISWLDDAFPARADRDDGPLRRASRREMQQPMRYARMLTVRGIRSPASYGFGLMVFDEPESGTVVSHSGGVPGYGSNMRWLPGRRVGAVALANTTYAPMAELTARLVDAVIEQVRPIDRTRPDPTLLQSAAIALVELLNAWSDDDALELLTTSSILDEPLDRRSAEARDLVDDIGTLTLESVEPITSLRGTVVCGAADGSHVEISTSLAPRRPPQLQSYEIERRPTP